MEIFFLIVWLIFGGVSSIVMENKGRSGCGGFALGFLLGPIGLVIALALKASPEELEKRQLAEFKARKCPTCAEIVRWEARKCRFCGADLPERPKL